MAKEVIILGEVLNVHDFGRAPCEYTVYTRGGHCCRHSERGVREEERKGVNDDGQE
jgi:hypothetical protein